MTLWYNVAIIRESFTRLLRHRIIGDTAGYLLLLAALLIGWLPGPGGIPLTLGGLGLLSIHNSWARRLRDYLLERSGALFRRLLRGNRIARFVYDVLVAVLLVIVSMVAWHHGDTWMSAIVTILLAISVAIALVTQHNYAQKASLKHKH